MSPELELSSEREIIRTLNIKREKTSPSVWVYLPPKSTTNPALLLNSLFIWSFKGEGGHRYESSEPGVHETRI